MAEDENNVEETEQVKTETKTENKSTEAPQSAIPTPEVPRQPEVDPDIADIRAELEEIKKSSQIGAEDKEKAKKFDEVSRAISGGDVKVFDKQKFFEELAENPEETLDKFIAEKTKPLHQKLREKDLAEADNKAFASLRAKYSDFDEVIGEAGKYLTKEDLEQTKDLPSRTEIRFSLARNRRNADVASRKSTGSNALNEAKKIANKNSITETPSTGAGLPDSGNELQEKLKKAKENFDSESVADILAEDIWHLSGQGRS